MEEVKASVSKVNHKFLKPVNKLELNAKIVLNINVTPLALLYLIL